MNAGNNFSDALFAIDKLKVAISDCNKRSILSAYDIGEKVDWEKVPDAIFAEWEKLVDEGNEIIYA